VHLEWRKTIYRVGEVFLRTTCIDLDMELSVKSNNAQAQGDESWLGSGYVVLGLLTLKLWPYHRTWALVWTQVCVNRPLFIIFTIYLKPSSTKEYQKATSKQLPSLNAISPLLNPYISILFPHHYHKSSPARYRQPKALPPEPFLQDQSSPSNPIPKRKEDAASFPPLVLRGTGQGLQGWRRSWVAKCCRHRGWRVVLFTKVWLEMCHGMRVKRDRERPSR